MIETAALPRLFVRIESAEPFRLAYKPGRPGARYRGGFRDMAAVCADAEKAGVPDHCEIVFGDES